MQAPFRPAFLRASFRLLLVGFGRLVQNGGPREGCEQGDPLAPALCALGQHAALHAAQARLRSEDEEVFAFLDDLYVLTCVVASNHGKTRTFGWSSAPAPPEVAELGPDVGRVDKAPKERGS